MRGDEKKISIPHYCIDEYSRTETYCDGRSHWTLSLKVNQVFVNRHEIFGASHLLFKEMWWTINTVEISGKEIVIRCIGVPDS